MTMAEATPDGGTNAMRNARFSSHRTVAIAGVTAIAGLLVLGAGLWLLAGREISGWRRLLRRNRGRVPSRTSPPALKDAVPMESAAGSGASLP